MENISNIFTTYYTTENIGEVQLGNANLKEILAALLTEFRIMEHSVKTAGTSTPQGAFHSTIVAGLKNLGYPKILEMTAELVNYITYPKFGGATIGATLGFMAKRTKETFDFRFDLSFAELNHTLDECKMSLIIKAHRLFLAELCKKIARTYNPADIVAGKAFYRKFAGEATQLRNGKTVTVPTFTEHSSADFADYATLLKEIYTSVYAYSDSLSEFTKIFVDAVTASKEMAAKLAMDRRPKTLAEQRGSPKIEKKTTPLPPQKKVVPKTVNAPTVNAPTVNAPTVNAWAQRNAEFELAKDLFAVAEKIEAEAVDQKADVEAVDQKADVEAVDQKADVEAVDEKVEVEAEKVEPDSEFVEVSRKKAVGKKVHIKTTNTAKNANCSSRAKALAAITS